MKTHARRWAAAAAALALLAAGAFALNRAPKLLASDPMTELPDPPFRPVGADFPRIIPVREAPKRTDKAAFDAYRTERVAVWKYLTEGGAVARAKPEEREAVAAALDDRYAKAKALGLKVLKADEESIPGLYAVAVARASGDANLPDGLFLIRRARRIAERKGRANPADADAREWYLRTLYFEYDVLRDLGRNEEAIRAVENLERLYEPLPHLKVWTYFKLHRLDEAEAAIRQCEKLGRMPGRSANDRMALEGLRFRRVEHLEAARAAARIGEDSPVIWANGGGAALSCFLHAEAEASYLHAAEVAERIGRTRYSGSPFTPLSRLRVQQGRVAEGIDDLLRARAQRSERDPGSLADDQGEYDISVALAMLALGRVDDAERFTRRVVETPDRLGYTSDRPDDKALANAVVLWTVLSARRSVREERGGWGSISPEGTSESWALARLSGRIARQSDRPNVMRPNVPGSADIATWQLGSVLRMVPTGVAIAMVDQARKEETHPDAAPYLDALEAEARLLANDPAGALPMARKALEKLPKSGEVLLRGRTAAIAAEAARQLGKTDESRELWSSALADFPAAPRLLGLSVPVKIEAGSESSAMVDLLSRSPRFRVESWGLPLRIRVAGGNAAISLSRNDGSTHAEMNVKFASATELEEAKNQFLDLVASPKVRLTAPDVNALDGLPARKGSKQDDAVATQMAPGFKPGKSPQ